MALGEKAEQEVDRAIEKARYTTRDAAGNEVHGIQMGLPGRTIERLRRCQNCMHFDTGDAYQAQIYAACVRRHKAMIDAGASAEEINAEMDLIRAFETRAGEFGLCRKRIARTDPQAADDLTSAGYLCSTWSGAYGMKFGPEHGPIDKLNEELLDDRDEKLKPREE